MFEGFACPRRSGGGLSDCDRSCEQRFAWRKDVALEISIDIERSPAVVVLAGTLDGGTASNLVKVVGELIKDGNSSFELQTEALCVPDEGGGRASLVALEQLVQESGGQFIWDGSTASDRCDHPRRPAVSPAFVCTGQ
jgi:hypothetical protein